MWLTLQGEKVGFFITGGMATLRAISVRSIHQLFSTIRIPNPSAYI
jgi:hypothetical protein